MGNVGRSRVSWFRYRRNYTDCYRGGSGSRVIQLEWKRMETWIFSLILHSLYCINNNEWDKLCVLCVSAWCVCVFECVLCVCMVCVCVCVCVCVWVWCVCVCLHGVSVCLGVVCVGVCLHGVRVCVWVCVSSRSLLLTRATLENLIGLQFK